MDKSQKDKPENKKTRLTNDEFKKPVITFTDSLTSGEIKNLLEDYEKVNDLSKIPRGTHVRYFTKELDGEYKFRMGGILKINKDIPKFIVLSNGSKSWSVQIENTIFYAKNSLTKIKEEYNNKLFDKDEKIKQLINLQKIKNKELEDMKVQLEKLNKNPPPQ